MSNAGGRKGYGTHNGRHSKRIRYSFEKILSIRNPHKTMSAFIYNVEGV